MPRQNSQVHSGCQMVVVVKAVGVLESGIEHTEFLSLLVHPLYKASPYADIPAKITAPSFADATDTARIHWPLPSSTGFRPYSVPHFLSVSGRGNLIGEFDVPRSHLFESENQRQDLGDTCRSSPLAGVLQKHCLKSRP